MFPLLNIHLRIFGDVQKIFCSLDYSADAMDHGGVKARGFLIGGTKHNFDTSEVKAGQPAVH